MIKRLFFFAINGRLGIRKKSYHFVRGVRGQRRFNVNERNWFHRDILFLFLTAGKKGLVSIRYKLGITPEEILFIDRAKGEKNDKVNLRDARARARAYTLRCRWSRYCRPSQAQVKPGCAGCNCGVAGSGRSAVRGYSALCISFPVTLRRHEGETPHPSRGNFAVWSFASSDSCIRLDPAVGRPAASRCSMSQTTTRKEAAVLRQKSRITRPPVFLPIDLPQCLPDRKASVHTSFEFLLRAILTAMSRSAAIVREKIVFFALQHFFFAWHSWEIVVIASKVTWYHRLDNSLSISLKKSHSDIRKFIWESMSFVKTLSINELWKFKEVARTMLPA